jgi:beta-N-acetylhexosaminidase
MSRPIHLAAAGLAVAGLLATVQPATAVTRHAAPRTAASVLAEMTLPQQVGQLFMVGSPATAAGPTTLAQISRYHVGNVILTGRSHAGTAATARVVRALQARTSRTATDGVRLLVATDQEGGAVQVLHGSGFDEIPSALTQGRWSLSRLRQSAGRWAGQLRAGGVTMDLAPVVDTVPSPAAARQNPPVGAFDREFGYTVTRVANHGRAFLRGLAGQGVVAAAKHFPGLGRVHANTDTSAGVTDRVTRRHDPYLAPFATAVAAGVPFVMMSTAYYTHLDPRNPAAFSPFVIRTVLRGDLGFTGAVISDDLGSARQVSAWRPGVRAVRFLRAGGDVVLTVDPGTVPAMYDAVLRRARSVPAFRTLVRRAALKVLQVKERQHLL